MSSRTARCSDCQRVVKVPSSVPAGKRLVCPQCGGRVLVGSDEEVDAGEANAAAARPASAASNPSKSSPRVKTKENVPPSAGAPGKSSPRLKDKDAAPLAPVTASPESPAGSFLRRPVGVAALVTVLLVAGSIGAAVYFNRAPRETPVAARPADGEPPAATSGNDARAKDDTTEKDGAEEKSRSEFRRLLAQGNDALAERRFEEAVKAFEQAKKLFPDDTAAAQGLGTARAALAPAPDTGKPAVDKVKADFTQKMDEGKAALAEKKFLQAVQAFEGALKLVPGEAAAAKALAETRAAMAAADTPDKPTNPGEFLATAAQAKDKEKPKDEGTPTEVDGKTFIQWKADIRDKDISVRQHAIRTIVRFGPTAREAVPNLILALGERDASVRGDAAAALGMLGAMEKGIDAEDVSKVVTALSNLLGKTESQHSVRLQAALAIAQLGPRAKNAIGTLCSVDNARDQYSWELRKAVCYALGRISVDPKSGADPRAVNALLNSLGDACGPVRLEAILALSAMGVPPQPLADQEKRELEKRLNDPDKTVSIWARVLLYFLDEKLVNEKGLSFIVSFMLKDPDPQVRKTAAQALGILGPKAKSKIPDLVTALRDKDLGVVLMVIGALGIMVQTTDSAVALGEVEGALQDPELAARAQAAQTLGKLGKKAKGSIPKLTACLKDKEPTMVYTVLAALAQLGATAESALPDIKEVAANHKEDSIKKAATEAIRIINEAMKKKA